MMEQHVVNGVGTTGSLVGSITFGPRPESTERNLGGQSSYRYQTEVDIFAQPPPRRQSFVWLIECFANGGVGPSRGLYWAGRSNRVEVRQGSVEITPDPCKARRIPRDCQELALDIAAALNKLREPGNTDMWHAVEHGFA